MKQILFGIIAVKLFQLISSDEDQCINWARKTISMRNCCIIIPFIPGEYTQRVLNDLPKELEKDKEFYSCMIWKKICEKINVLSLDQSELYQFFEKSVQDNDWVAVFKNSTDSCLQHTSKNAYQYQQSLDFKKEECDVRYETFMNCLITISRLICPAKSFISTNQCEDARKFVRLCGDSKAAIQEYLLLHKVE